MTDVVVDGDRVAAVGTGLTADDEIDATGMIVGPGFVDLHSHAHGIAGQRLQALDGVTAALDLEAGLMPLAAGYRQAAAEGRPLHYGFSASWSMARGRVLAGVHPEPDILGSLAATCTTAM